MEIASSRVIIGSGFGGGVAAMRAAEEGLAGGSQGFRPSGIWPLAAR